MKTNNNIAWTVNGKIKNKV